MILETLRTTITPISDKDIAEILAMYVEPDSFRFIAPHKDKSIQYYTKFLEGKIVANKEQIGFWSVRDKVSKELIGTVNLNLFMKTEMYHIGCHLRTKFWNQGFAKELCGELANYGFEKRKLKEIHGVVEFGNLVSEKLMTSLGFSLKEQVEIEGCKLNIYYQNK